jgi:NAD(P)H-hydrate epimerase
MNGLKGIKVALDLPTGIDTDDGNVSGSAFFADTTVTFGRKKTGLLLNEGKQRAGKLVTESCGLCYPSAERKPEYFIFEREDALARLLRNPQGNKGSFGKLGIIAGSESIPGAAILCVSAAFACGAGYVRLMTHENNKEGVMQAAPETLLSLYGGNEPAIETAQLRSLPAFADVICIGPGIGTGMTGRRLLEGLLDELESNLSSSRHKALVLDADALNLIAETPVLLSRTSFLTGQGVSVVMTPHLLEFARLTGLTVSQIRSNKRELAQQFAAEHGIILVLKDAQTLIASPKGQVCIAAQGNEGMAVAGSGDVLTGILAACLGMMKTGRDENGALQQDEAFLMTCLGVFVQQLSGAMAKKQMGSHSMTPHDQLRFLKRSMKKLGKEAEEKYGTVR